MFGLGRRLWGGSLGSLQNIQSFGKIKTFVSCEKKLEIFCYEILFRENLDIFSKNCLSTNRTPFYQTKSKVFVKHQNVLLKSTKIAFFTNFENGCKSPWFVLKNKTVLPEIQRFGLRIWVLGLGFGFRALFFWFCAYGFGFGA